MAATTPAACLSCRPLSTNWWRACEYCALRLEQLLLAQQHVDDRTRADFEAGLRRIERALRGNDGLLGRFHLADAGDHRAIGVARAGNDAAAREFFLILRDIALADRLAHLRAAPGRR